MKIISAWDVFFLVLFFQKLSRQMTFVIEKNSGAYQLSIVLSLSSVDLSVVYPWICIIVIACFFSPSLSLSLAVHYSSVVYIHSIHQSCFSSNVNNMNQTREHERNLFFSSRIKLLLSMSRAIFTFLSFYICRSIVFDIHKCLRWSKMK